MPNSLHSSPPPELSPAIDYAGKTPKIDLLFDSGAFSAWKLGKPIVLDTYCDYLLANKSWMGAYVALDVINPDSPEAAAKASFENYMHMRKRGLDPIPVLHVKEDISWLYRMIDAGATYIGLSASSLTSRNHINDWYAQCWDKLTDSSGRPLIKAHAFGEGRYSALSAFPWYSADSTSWIYMSQRNAQIPLPGGKVVSHRNDGANDRTRQDIQSMPVEELHAFERYLAEHGVDRSAFYERNVISTTICTYLALLYYLEQEKRVSALCPISHAKRGLFNATSGIDRAALNIPELKYYSVGGGNPSAYASIAFAGATRILISYFYVSVVQRGSNPNAARKKEPCFGGDPLKAFLYEPQETCATMEPMKKSWDILKEYVSHAK